MRKRDDSQGQGSDQDQGEVLLTQQMLNSGQNQVKDEIQYSVVDREQEVQLQKSGLNLEVLEVHSTHEDVALIQIRSSYP